jgi:hypothetical protein
MAFEESVALGIASSNGWLDRYFSNPSRTTISDAELRLLLCWLLNRNRRGPDAHRRLAPPDPAAPLGRLDLTPERVRTALVSAPNTMAYRILHEFDTVAATSGIQFDPKTLDDDRRFVRDKLDGALRAEQHVARREILLQLLDHGEYAAISTLSDFWADFVCYDIELAYLLQPDGHVAIHSDAYVRLLNLLLFKYISLRDVDRLCPVLRATRYLLPSPSEYLLPSPSELYTRGVVFISDLCFDRGGATAHAAAFHFAKSKSGSDLDVDAQVILKTTISTLVTLVECSGAGPAPWLQSLQPASTPRATPPAPSAFKRPLGASRKSIDDGDLTAEIRAAESRAIGWLERSIDSFDPFHYGESDKFEFSTKMLAELAFVFTAYQSCTGSPNRTVVEAMRRTLFDRVVARPDLWSFLLQNLSTLPGFSLYASMLECGFIDDELHRKLGNACKQSNIVSGEYAPALFMDIAHSIIRCGFPWTGPSIPALYERSLLASLPDLLCLKDPDYYTITHTIFFVTDFGRQPDRLPRHVQAFFASNLETMAFFFSARENWDLLGEILLCQIYLKLDGTAAFSRYMRLLLSTQTSDGSFISEFSANDDNAEGKANPWTDLLDKYHTTLVFLLLATAKRDTVATADLRLTLV